MAAAVVVVVAAAVSSLVLWLGEGDNSDTNGGGATQPPPSAAPPATTGPTTGPTGAAQPTVTRLTLAPQQARCLVPTAAGLRSAAVAFEGTVAQIGPRAVLLDVSSWLHADGFGGTNTVRVALPAAGTDSPVAFRAGRTYLVAATGDAKVMACGLSGVKTPDLSKLYAAAF